MRAGGGTEARVGVVGTSIAVEWRGIEPVLQCNFALEKEYVMRAIYMAVLGAGLALPLAAGAQEQQTTTMSIPTQTTETTRTTTNMTQPMSKSEMKTQRNQQKMQENSAKNSSKAARERQKALQHQNKATNAAEKAQMLQ